MLLYGPVDGLLTLAVGLSDKQIEDAVTGLVKNDS